MLVQVTKGLCNKTSEHARGNNKVNGTFFAIQRERGLK